MGLAAAKDSTMSQKLLITGASGHLGRATIDALLARGVAAGDIIATTRDVSKLADLAAKGVEVRKADFNDVASLQAAFKGADRLAIVSTDAIDGEGTRLKQQTAAVHAAKAAGVKHIVYTSMPNPSVDSHITFAGDHRGTEEAVKASGVPYTILRNAWYQENLFMSLPQVLASGHWYTSTGYGKVNNLARADCAAALAAALASDSGESKTYTLTGGEKLTTSEIAALASEVLGKKIEVIQLNDEQLAGGMKAAGVPEFLIPFLIGFEANTRVGDADIQTDDVEKLTGRKPTPFRAFFEANKAALLG
jgi:NAD(P)H dehydrogenase (quinone)